MIEYLCPHCDALLSNSNDRYKLSKLQKRCNGCNDIMELDSGWETPIREHYCSNDCLMESCVLGDELEARRIGPMAVKTGVVAELSQSQPE